MSPKPSSSPLPAEAPGANAGAKRLWRGAISGALAGLSAGAMDALWGWSAVQQFLPSLSARSVFLLHLALSYACAGALVGAAVGACLHLLQRHTDLPLLLQGLAGGTRKPRSESLLSLSQILVGVPLLALATSAAYWNAIHLLATRKHAGLMITASILLTLLAIFLAILAFFLLARILEACLRPVRHLRALSSPYLLGLVLVLVCLACGWPFYRFWLGKLGPLPGSQLWTVPGGFVLLLSLPRVGAALLRRMNERKEAPAANQVRVLALVLAGLPTLALGLGVAFILSAKGIHTRAEFVIARAMGITTCAIVLVAYATLVLTLLVESLLAPLAASKARYLAWRHLPLLLAALLMVLGSCAALALTWKTVSLLRLRPLWVCALALALSFGSYQRARPWALSLAKLRTAAWVPLALASWSLLFVGVLGTGDKESVRKATVLHSGLGAPLAGAYRTLGDWDRDGYSRWLGGGDCDDANPRVHPNAEEIPFDGIDNNCLRGDVKERSANATQFAAVPKELDPDFNIILITIDTIRADHVGAYGYSRNTTPNLDALAASGTLFQNGWAHAPSTRYSIPALLTGRYPLNVSYSPIPGQWPGLAEKNLTIAEVLKSRGLTTGAILNYWYFDEHRKMNQGFDFYDNQNKRLHRAVQGTGPSKTSGSSSKEQTDKSIEFVSKHQAERFFLWVHYYDPHYDYETHEDTPIFGTSKVDAYDHEIAYTDKHIGRLLDDLKSKGLDKKTVIVVTGDHGEGFGEHGIDLHGYHLYAAQTKVPLIIYVPGTEPSVVVMPAGHVDVLPTLANLAGAASDALMLGQSLVGVISGSDDRNAERYVFQQLSYENNNEYRGAASSKCHILYNVSPNLSWELYRIDQDPMEERDIIDSPGQCQEARAVLETWYDHSEIPDGAQEALLASPPILDDAIGVDYAKAMRLVQIKIPKTVRRGESALVEYTWEAMGTPPLGWKIFAHFEASGGARFTDDHEPTRPFSWWKSGQHIRYTRTLHVAKTQRLGSYKLWFGLYKGQERLAPTLSTGGPMVVLDRRIHLATIEVVQ